MWVCTPKDLGHLKDEIFSKTGIPPTKQKFLHNGKLIATDQALLQVGHDGNVFLSIGLCGGAGECDICFSVGEFTCPECNNQVTCKVCCERVYKHPQRAQHQPPVFKFHKRRKYKPVSPMKVISYWILPQTRTFGVLSFNFGSILPSNSFQ